MGALPWWRGMIVHDKGTPVGCGHFMSVSSLAYPLPTDAHASGGSATLETAAALIWGLPIIFTNSDSQSQCGHETKPHHTTSLGCSPRTILPDTKEIQETKTLLLITTTRYQSKRKFSLIMVLPSRKTKIT